MHSFFKPDLWFIGTFKRSKYIYNVQLYNYIHKVSNLLVIVSFSRFSIDDIFHWWKLTIANYFPETNVTKVDAKPASITLALKVLLVTIALYNVDFVPFAPTIQPWKTVIFIARMEFKPVPKLAIRKKPSVWTAKENATLKLV